MTRKNFAITGVAGFVAPRHLRAIKESGHNLIAAMDPFDSVGILDRYFFDVPYFKEFERFDRYLEKLRRGPENRQMDFLSICCPNYLHDAHIRLALRCGADAICEKPLVTHPWNCDQLQELESELGRRVYAILQLRLHPSVVELKKKLASTPRHNQKHRVKLTYITSRGQWYLYSWKGKPEHSGGLVSNIGIHFFDMLIWLFGRPQISEVTLEEPTRVAGQLELERAYVDWHLSINHNDLPPEYRGEGATTFRSIAIDGQEVEFSQGFTDLHTRSYEEVLGGRGFGIDDARPSIQLTYDLRFHKKKHYNL